MLTYHQWVLWHSSEGIFPWNMWNAHDINQLDVFKNYIFNP